jgi:GH25 family lysozyme M1 (1,4-beta-N-acetylmuramidase)
MYRLKGFSVFSTLIAILLAAAAPARAAREEGIDVSQHQLEINWSQVAGSGKTFAFVRATRGGTTAENGRLDDTHFLQNITGAKAAGLRTGAYHFARPDIATSTPEDEAAHFLSIAGDYMVPGHLRPVLDLESGDVERTSEALSDWALRFCNAIAAAKGEQARPIIYLSRYYANTQLTDAVTVGGKKLTDHALWLANYDTFNYATDQPVNHQTDPTPPPFYLGDETPIYPNPLGLWGPDTGATPKTWAFWQYNIGTAGTVPGITTAIDLDVFHSELGSMDQFMIPEPTVTAPLALLALLARRRRRRSA